MPALRCFSKPDLLPSSVLSVISTGAFANDDTNTIVNRGDSMVYDPVLNFLYEAVYRNLDGQLVIGRCTPGGPWTFAVATTPIISITDDHNFISLGCDGSGRLKVAWGMHNVPMNLWQAATPGDFAVTAAGVQAVPLVAGMAGPEALVTYPCFRRVANGDVIFIWRTGGSGNGNWIVYRWVDLASAWTLVNANWLSGSPAPLESAYPNTIWVDVTDRFHVSWQWRSSSVPTTAHDLYYQFSDDGLLTNRDVSGNILPASIQRNNVPTALVRLIPQPSLNYNPAQATCCDAGRRPIIITYYDDGGGLGTQFWAERWNGSAWVRSQFGFFDNVNWTAVSRPLAIFYKGSTYLFFSLSIAGVEQGTVCFYSRNADLSNVQTAIVDPTPIKDSSVTMTMSGWRYAGKLWILNQRNTLSGTIPSNGPNLLDVNLSP